MSTIHANSPVDCLYRLETCALLSGVNLPLSALRSQVASAVDMVAHTARLPDGSRKMVAVSEVLPLVSGEYAVRDLVRWRTEALTEQGKLEGTFERLAPPTFAEEAARMGFPLEGLA